MRTAPLLPCTFCKAKPAERHWHHSEMRVSVFGSSIEVRVCPRCQDKIGRTPCVASEIMGAAFEKVRDELEHRIAVAYRGPGINGDINGAGLDPDVQ